MTLGDSVFHQIVRFLVASFPQEMLERNPSWIYPAFFGAGNYERLGHAQLLNMRKILRSLYMAGQCYKKGKLGTAHL